MITVTDLSLAAVYCSLMWISVPAATAMVLFVRTAGESTFLNSGEIESTSGSLIFCPRSVCLF